MGPCCIALIVVSVLILLYNFAFGDALSLSPRETYIPGLYSSTADMGETLVFPDDAGETLDGLNSDFWFLDRHNDRIRGLYSGGHLSRTGCNFVSKNDPMMPFSSKIYIDGGPTYERAGF